MLARMEKNKQAVQPNGNTCDDSERTLNINESFFMP